MSNTITLETQVEFLIGTDADGDDIYEEITIELTGSSVEASGDGWNEPHEDAHVEDITVKEVRRADGTVVEKTDPIYDLAETWSDTAAAQEDMDEAMVAEQEYERDSYYDRYND